MEKNVLKTRFKIRSKINNPVFWDTTPCSPLKVNRRFGETCRLQLQSRRISEGRNQPSSACIPEDRTLHNQCCEDFRSYTGLKCRWILLKFIFFYCFIDIYGPLTLQFVERSGVCGVADVLAWLYVPPKRRWTSAGLQVLPYSEIMLFGCAEYTFVLGDERNFN
jgi:hypothetical protein